MQKNYSLVKLFVKQMQETALFWERTVGKSRFVTFEKNITFTLKFALYYLHSQVSEDDYNNIWTGKLVWMKGGLGEGLQAIQYCNICISQ